MFAAFPPRDLWFLALPALGLLYACLTVGRPRVRTGALCGLLFGLAFFLPLLPWIGVFVGALPWIALSVVMALYCTLFGVMATVVTRLPAAPVWFAVVWVAVEWLRSSFPFGGFPWGAAAFSQNTGLLLPVARWIGVPGLSFVVALAGAGLAQLTIAALRKDRSLLPAGVIATVVPLTAAAVAGLTMPDPHTGRHLQVAAVQGGVPRMGLDFNEQRRQVLDNHLRATMALKQDVDAGTRPHPEVVLWPENASDISPLDNPDAAEEIRSAVGLNDVPLLFGTLLVDHQDGRPTNSVLLWTENGGTPADAPTGRYDKHIVQPFGEYLPWRGFFSKFSSYADRAGDFKAGSGPSVLAVPTDRGDVVVGVSTCWEIAFDRAPRAAVREGAQLLYVPTNNATFGYTDMTYQQLAMSQVRAVETDRSAAVVATSGVSALITPDGRVVTNSRIFDPAVLSTNLPLRTDRTLAVRLGALPQLIVVVCALLGFLFAARRHTRFDTFWVRPDDEREGETRA
ncbi:MAG: apolipoprotein N-acyltransferase [Gordonia sp. (in: high G+C Gram-positive bacteria)]